MLLGLDILELNRSILNLFSLVILLNVDMLAAGMGFGIFGKSNCALVVAVNDHYTQGKICVLRPDKKAGVRRNQLNTLEGTGTKSVYGIYPDSVGGRKRLEVGRVLD